MKPPAPCFGVLWVLDNHLHPEGFHGVWRWGRRPAGCGHGTGPHHSHPEAGARRARWGGGGARAQRCVGTWQSLGVSMSAFGPGMPCWPRGCLWGQAEWGCHRTPVPQLMQPPRARAARPVFTGSCLMGVVSGIPATRPLHPPIHLPLLHLSFIYSFTH